MDTINKKKLLIYSDCYIYGGSEMLLSFIILNQTINDNYEIHFAYRAHRLYETGLKESYGDNRLNFHPLTVFSNDTVFHKINTLAAPLLLKKVLKMPFWLIQKSGLYFIYNFFLFIFLLKKIRPQLIHINNGGYPGARSCLAFVLAAKFVKLKSIVYQVNNIAYLPKSNFSAWVDKKIINQNVKYFLTSSKKVKEALIQNRNFPPEKIIIVPNTISDKQIKHNREEINKELGLSGDAFLICEVAFLSKRKGQLYLLKAVNIIKALDLKLFEKLKIVLVGNGEEELNLKKFVNDNGITSSVIFTGYRPDSIDFINACDIFILPSVSNEDMPLVVLEAMKLEKTIIASRFGGIEEEIENGISGILVEPNPGTLEQDIAKEIINIFNNKNTIAYGENARKRYDDFFSAKMRETELLKIYQLVLNDNNKSI